MFSESSFFKLWSRGEYLGHYPRRSSTPPFYFVSFFLKFWMKNKTSCIIYRDLIIIIYKMTKKFCRRRETPQQVSSSIHNFLRVIIVFRNRSKEGNDENLDLLRESNIYYLISPFNCCSWYLILIAPRIPISCCLLI